MMTSCSIQTTPSPYQVVGKHNKATKLNPYSTPYGKETEMLISFGCNPRNDIFLFAGM